MGQALSCLCHQHLARAVRLESGLELLKCEGCGLYARQDRPEPELLASHYRDEYWAHFAAEQATEARSNLFAHVMTRVRERHRRPGRLLDIGCGTGNLLSVAHMDGWTAVGIEPSLQAAEHGRQNGREIVVGEWPVPTWPEQSVDAVVFLNVLDHLPDPGAAVQAAWRALRPSGVLYVRVPNGTFHVRLLSQRAPALGRLAVLHLYGFGGRALRHLLTRVGFIGVDVRTAPLSQQDAYVGGQRGWHGILRRMAKGSMVGLYQTAAALGLDRWAWGPSIEATAVKGGDAGDIGEVRR